MSGHQTGTIEDTIFFWFAANDTSGSGGDGATPLFDVREAGAAASAIPLLSGTPTLLTHANFPAGCHEISVAATTGNGFAANDTFAVFCTLLVDSQNPSGFVGSCTLTPLAKTAALTTLAAELAILTDAVVLTSATIETVTDQLNFIIPATADATDDDAYNNAVAVFIDGSDPNQKSYRSVKNYTASTRSIEIRRAPDFTVTTSDTITLLTTDPHVFTHSKDVIGTIEALRGHHTAQPIGNVFYVDTTNGASFASGARGGINDPLASIQDCEDNLVVDSNHDVVFILAGASGQTTINEAVTLAKRYTFWRGPGRDVIWTRTTNGNTIAITGDGIEISGVQIGTHSTGSGNGIDISNADFVSVRHCWILDTRGDGVRITTSNNCIIEENNFAGTGVSGSGQGIHIVGTAGTSNNNNIFHNHFSSTAGDALLIEGGTTNDTIIAFNAMSNSGGWGINIGGSSTDAIVHDNTFGNNSSGNIQDNGTNSILLNNEQWSKNSITTETRLAELDPANLPSDIDDILADTNELQGDDVPGLIAALPTAAENFTAVLTTQLSESYAADGVAPTLAQLSFLVQQSLHEFAIAGTTRTVKKLDGSTSAATFTLDDATNPTSTTRAT